MPARLPSWYTYKSALSFVPIWISVWPLVWLNIHPCPHVSALAVWFADDFPHLSSFPTDLPTCLSSSPCQHHCITVCSSVALPPCPPVSLPLSSSLSYSACYKVTLQTLLTLTPANQIPPQFNSPCSSRAYEQMKPEGTKEKKKIKVRAPIRHTPDHTGLNSPTCTEIIQTWILACTQAHWFTWANTVQATAFCLQWNQEKCILWEGSIWNNNSVYTFKDQNVLCSYEVTWYLCKKVLWHFLHLERPAGDSE